MPKKMSQNLLTFLYDLAVDRAERKKFYRNPKAYLAKSKLTSQEKDLLLREAIAIGRVYRARRRAHGAGPVTARSRLRAIQKVPYESEFERVYGTRMPAFTDEDFMDKEKEKHKEDK